MRLVRLRVAVHADVADARGRHEGQDAVDHAEAGAQDGDDRDLLAGDLLARGLLERGLDLDVLEREVAHGLVALEDGQLGHELAEVLRGGVLVPQDVQLVLHEGVVDDLEALLVKLHA